MHLATAQTWRSLSRPGGIPGLLNLDQPSLLPPQTHLAQGPTGTTESDQKPVGEGLSRQYSRYLCP